MKKGGINAEEETYKESEKRRGTRGKEKGRGRERERQIGQAQTRSPKFAITADHYPFLTTHDL